ncbi:predicted protein [Naegleria gruberi]|uniref:Predicted protein n=1 Tax=Naegleria gruberi TaxID=5762 RepID=D2V9C6_NAEGR|nr:uncharacterized protein NAEGRDRAFT_65393 [Naegleria gruberi]EFC46568.1 predicted protein [Naegleria gruberi]|eukprot:XP_002679312.1 predicted protein [Naegleria gruberi strain NEG-M]
MEPSLQDYSTSPSLSTLQPQQIPLISYIDGKFQVDKKAISVISKIKEPVAVLSIAGVYRSGKSFLLNQILDRNDGFTTSPSHLPCTKGLWVWSVPMKVSNDNHPDFRLLIVDSEGIGSFSANETYDTQVFSLALLMSSMFIYNSQGSIDDNAITRLGLVTELSKYVKSKLGGLDNQAIFPSFLWVVRDFSLDLQITPKNYLEFALSSEERYTETERNKQQIKASLKQYFRDRDCFTLVRPIHDEKKLQNASKLESYEIRPEFRNQIEKLKQKILDTVAPKELGGRMLNGRIIYQNLQNKNAKAVKTERGSNRVGKHSLRIRIRSSFLFLGKFKACGKRCSIPCWTIT